MTSSAYHYTECGLEGIYIVGGYKFIDTPRGRAVSIKDMDELHRAIGLLEVSEEAIRYWETGEVMIPKSSEVLVRSVYKKHLRGLGISGVYDFC